MRMLPFLVVVGFAFCGAVSSAHGQAGSLDATFGEDGVVTQGIGVAEKNVARGAVVQSDGRVVLAGSADNLSLSASWFGLARFHSRGTLDTSFGTGGHAEAGFEYPAAAHAIALQPDGRLVAVGWTEESGGGPRAFALARFGIDGTPDVTFGDNGLVVTPFGGGAEANAVALQPDGRIVVAGIAASGGGFAVARYLPDGTLDPDFGDGGRVTITFDTYSSARAIAIDSAERIVVAGHGGRSLVVVRFLDDGSPDLTFGTNGRVLLNLDSYTLGYALALQPPDDRIVVAGSVIDTGGGRDFVLVRLAEDGALDSTFGESGAVRTEFSGSSYAHALAIAPDSEILAAGHELGNGGGAVLARYLPDGELDPTFGEEGRLRDVGLSDAWALSAVASGRAIVAGTAALPRGSGFAATRLFADGRLDPSFGGDGSVTTRGFGTSNAAATAVATLPDGRTVAAGCATTRSGRGFYLARFDAEGALDPSFGEDGVVVTEFGEDACVYDLALQPDGRLLALGTSSGLVATSSRLAAARYLPNGTLDSTFGEEGRVMLFPAFAARTFQLLPEGQIVAGGCLLGVGGGLALARLLPDGAPDLTFSEDGLTAAGLAGCAVDLAVHPDGRTVAVGSVTRRVTTDESDGVMYRFLPDGSLDAAFGSLIHLSLINELTMVNLQPDGGVIVGGYFGPVSVTFNLLRYTPEGTRDLSFGEEGLARPLDNGRDLAVLPDGRLFVAGSHDAHLALARLLPDGALDPAFGVGGVTTTEIETYSYASALSFLADGRAVASGGSASTSGTRMVIVRYLEAVEVAAETEASPSITAMSVFPNPSAREATVNLALATASEVSVTVYDVLGRRAAMLYRGPLGMGTHTFALDAARLPAGLYLVRATGDGVEATQRITVLR
ncbi:MAG: T9SS type A sorting domain-containing protein [Rhodothermales bacterium]